LQDKLCADLSFVWGCVPTFKMHKQTNSYGAWDAEAVDAAGGVSGGTMGGPMVFWADDYAMVYSPITQAMEMNLQWSNSSSSMPASTSVDSHADEGTSGGSSGALEAGLLGSITEIPANYTSETMLFLGRRDPTICAPRACGINSAVASWGKALRRYKGKDTRFPAGGFDQTLAYLGYYSDNGAFYYYYTGPETTGRPVDQSASTAAASAASSSQNYGTAFTAVYEAEVRGKGIPLKYLQIDSYWYYKGAGGGVQNWTWTPEAFPDGLPALTAATEWPFVAHNRYWDPHAVYAKQNGGKCVAAGNLANAFQTVCQHSRRRPRHTTPMVPVYIRSLTRHLFLVLGYTCNLPLNYQISCVLVWLCLDRYNFIVEADTSIPDSQPFWDDLMMSSKAWGMVVYEQDWLHNEWEKLNCTLSSATLSTRWLHQMGEGARKAGVSIQCVWLFLIYLLSVCLFVCLSVCLFGLNSEGWFCSC
jgi:hypothetical protein